MTRHALLGTVLASAGLVLLGCSGSSDLAGGAHGVKIQEYVGDGHGGTKPWPSFLPRSGSPAQPVTTQVAAPALAHYAAYVTDSVEQMNVSWYRLPAVSTATTWVVTVQPTANRDSDLYMIEGNAAAFGDGANYRGSSNRLPTASGELTRGVGYAPDWAYMTTTGSTAGHPSAFIAVYGVPDLNLGSRPLRIEADIAGNLYPNGSARAGSLAAGNSLWFYFYGLGSSQYTVKLSAVQGDPDLYVYGQRSIDFLGKDTNAGNGQFAFTSPTDKFYFVRVYAYNGCKYALRVLRP